MSPEAYQETTDYLTAQGRKSGRLGIRLAGGQRYVGEVVDGTYVVHVVRDKLPPITVDKAAIVAVDAWTE